MTTLSPKTWPRWSRLFASGVVFGVIGYGVGQLLATQVFPDGPSASDLNLRWSDILAALVAAGMVIGAGAVLITSLDAGRLGRMYGLEGAASATEIGQARFQSVVMGFSGVILILPVIFSLTGVPALIGVAAVAVLLALHTVMNVRVYLQADELLRRAVLESAAVTFFLGQGLLFVWAAAERLGLAPTITAWDIYAVLMAFYLFASLVVSIRRGLT